MAAAELPAAAGLPPAAGRDSVLPVTGEMELRDLSCLPEGVTEILSMNCTEPDEEVVDVVADEPCLEAPGLTVLQLAIRNRPAIKRVVFNILSTSEDIGTTNIANKLPK